MRKKKLDFHTIIHVLVLLNTGEFVGQGGSLQIVWLPCNLIVETLGSGDSTSAVCERAGVVGAETMPR